MRLPDYGVGLQEQRTGESLHEGHGRLRYAPVDEAWKFEEGEGLDDNSRMHDRCGVRAEDCI
ncbi:hypothetical protein A5789_02865 [Nocardia sp. 852002-51101_SCH5132738]|nr:hypothetical protein A5789_02865 [Nocardia sp. 852002-51101_SCH5132738]OBF66257.1 hypothetical protein A9X06_06855 [Mycobacterium sp. 852002-51759_SCH5129042]